MSHAMSAHVGQKAIVRFKGKRVLGVVLDYDEERGEIKVSTPWGDPVFAEHNVCLVPITA